MARHARRKGISGYYHLIVRGNNKQVLFEEAEDYKFFISRMGRWCREAEIRICAYCLMENHVHLLVKDAREAVPGMMKKLSVSYSQYYNQKYERIGHLFQGRYLSEPVENMAYLLTVFRYILNNPWKAGICPASEYRWSSYKAYFRPTAPLYMDFVREQYPTEEAYRKYISAPNEDECLEYTPKVHDDDWAREVIRKTLSVQTGTEIQAWDLQKRNRALQHLNAEGLSLRQMERLTGISRRVIASAAPRVTGTAGAVHHG